MAKSMKEWKGETGLVDKGMLLRHLTTLQGPIYYIAGPPAMVAGVRKVLVAANVDEDDIRTEPEPNRVNRDSSAEACCSAHREFVRFSSFYILDSCF